MSDIEVVTLSDVKNLITNGEHAAALVNDLKRATNELIDRDFENGDSVGHNVGIVNDDDLPTKKDIVDHGKDLIGLSNVTNDTQAKASIYPNLTPQNAQILLGLDNKYVNRTLIGDAVVDISGTLKLVDTDVARDNLGLGSSAVLNAPETGSNALVGEVVKGDDTRLTDSRVASDVHPWAKEPVKPSYTKAEVGLSNVSNDLQAKEAIYPNNTPSVGQILVSDSDGRFQNKDMSGDVSIDELGDATLSNTIRARTNIGLGNVDNTADADKVVASANKLTTPRMINGVLFDGTSDINVSDVEALRIDNNLSDLSDKEAARDNLELGSASQSNVVDQTGISDVDLMSQKAVTDSLELKVDKEAGKGLIEPAPVDGKQYARKDNTWEEVISEKFSVHKVGLRSERSLYDDEPQGFCFFATDETIVNTPLKSEILPYSPTNEYLLEGFVGGALSLVVTVNGIIQSTSDYTVTDAGDGDYILGIILESDDILEAREIGRAFTNGAAYFKLSSASADWSDPVPFSQGHKGDKGDKGETGGVEEAPVDGKQYARKDEAWVEVTGGGGGGDVEEAPIDGKTYVRSDGAWAEIDYVAPITKNFEGVDPADDGQWVPTYLDFPDTSKIYKGTVDLKSIPGVPATYTASYLPSIEAWLVEMAISQVLTYPLVYITSAGLQGILTEFVNFHANSGLPAGISSFFGEGILDYRSLLGIPASTSIPFQFTLSIKAGYADVLLETPLYSEGEVPLEVVGFQDIKDKLVDTLGVSPADLYSLLSNSQERTSYGFKKGANYWEVNFEYDRIPSTPNDLDAYKLTVKSASDDSQSFRFPLL